MEGRLERRTMEADEADPLAESPGRTAQRRQQALPKERNQGEASVWARAE